MALPEIDASSCSFGALKEQCYVHHDEEKLYSLYGLLGEFPTIIQKYSGDYSSFIMDFSTLIRFESAKMDENYEWWKENSSKYFEMYKGQYLLIANRKIIASDKSLGNLETLARRFSHYIIFSVGTLSEVRRHNIGLPCKRK